MKHVKNKPPEWCEAFVNWDTIRPPCGRPAKFERLFDDPNAKPMRLCGNHARQAKRKWYVVKLIGALDMPKYSPYDPLPDPYRNLVRELTKAQAEIESLKAQLAECRDKTLEEAAEIAGGHFIYGHSVAGVHFAEVLVGKIRSLKGVKHDPE